MMPKPSVHVSALQYAYPDGNKALNGVDLTIAKGERVALLGPNGAGKTTLVMHLNGILSPTSGSIDIGEFTLDENNREVTKKVREKVGIVFQDPDDQLFMPTVYEDVAFGPTNMGLLRDEVERRSVGALEMVGMLELKDRAPHHLSFGQRRRVAVATVLAMEPEILILDEPSSNLDPASRRELSEILLSLNVTIFMVTHDLPYAFEICERSLILNNGKIVADDSTINVLRDQGLLNANRLELPKGFSF
jgi:cobalt/nickel transport system ATP-binding protein